MPSSTTIPPLVNATILGIIVAYISSWNFIQDIKLLVLTVCAATFDLVTGWVKSSKACETQAKKYIERALDISTTNQKVAIVTGSNTGIGYLTAKYLAQANYHVILACRDQNKADIAIKKVRREIGDIGTLEFIKLDLACLASVKQFVDQFKTKQLPLHLLINNAGVMKLRSDEITKDGLELHFQVNYLGHYLLTRLLEPTLMATTGARIIFLGSLVHYGANQFSLDKFQPRTSFDASSGYCYAKLAVTMLAYYFNRRFQDKDVYVGVADPGTTATELFRTLPIPSGLLSLFIQSPAAGVLSTIRLALGELPDKKAPLYCMSETLIPPNPLVLNISYQSELWKVSEEYVNVILSRDSKDKKPVFEC